MTGKSFISFENIYDYERIKGKITNKNVLEYLNSTENSPSVGFKILSEKMRSYENSKLEAQKKMRRKMKQISDEINEMYKSPEDYSIIQEIRQKVRRYDNKKIKRKIKQSEIDEDLNAIKGQNECLKVRIKDNVLKIEKSVFRKMDNLKVNMNGKDFCAKLTSISPKIIGLKGRNGKRYRVQIISIEKETVKFIKMKKNKKSKR